MRRENFDGDVTPQARIVASIHFSHAPGTERGKDFIRTEASARNKRHCAERANYTAPATSGLMLGHASAYTERHAPHEKPA